MEELSRGLEISIAEMEQMTAAHNKIKGILAASDVTVDQLTRMNEVLQVSSHLHIATVALSFQLMLLLIVLKSCISTLITLAMISKCQWKVRLLFSRDNYRCTR